MPKNDKELVQLLKNLGRNNQEIEAIKDFGKLADALKNPNEMDPLITDLKKKYGKRVIK